MAYLRIGENQAAEQIWNQAAQLQPSDTGIRLMQFNLARVTGDLAKMKEIEAWFEKENANDPAQVKILQAAVLVGTVRQGQREQLAANPQAPPSLDQTDQRNLAQAKSLLREVENLRPGWVEQPKLMADVALLEGRLDDAIDQLRKTLELGQPTGEVIKQLASLLHFRHRDPEAEELLTTNAAVVAGDPDIERLRVEVYLVNGKAQAALDTMKDRFPKDSADPMLHFLHGQMLAGAGKPDEAEAEYRKAIDLAPETSEAWLELIRLLVKGDKNDEALRVRAGGANQNSRRSTSVGAGPGLRDAWRSGPSRAELSIGPHGGAAKPARPATNRRILCAHQSKRSGEKILKPNPHLHSASAGGEGMLCLGATDDR